MRGRQPRRLVTLEVGVEVIDELADLLAGRQEQQRPEERQAREVLAAAQAVEGLVEPGDDFVGAGGADVVERRRTAGRGRRRSRR